MSFSTLHFFVCVAGECTDTCQGKHSFQEALLSSLHVSLGIELGDPDFAARTLSTGNLTSPTHVLIISRGGAHLQPQRSLKRQRQMHLWESEASLIVMVSSRTARTIYRHIYPYSLCPVFQQC